LDLGGSWVALFATQCSRKDPILSAVFVLSQEVRTGNFYEVCNFILDNTLAKIHKIREILHPWVMNQDHQPCYLQLWIQPLGSNRACHLWMLKLQCRQFWVLCIILLQTLFLHRVCTLCGKGRHFLCLTFLQQKLILRFLQHQNQRMHITWQLKQKIQRRTAIQWMLPFP